MLADRPIDLRAADGGRLRAEAQLLPGPAHRDGLSRKRARRRHASAHGPRELGLWLAQGAGAGASETRLLPPPTPPPPRQATSFFSNALKVRPVLDGFINVDPAIASGAVSGPFVLNTTAIGDADLVIIMTARPSPNSEPRGRARAA